MIKFQLYMGSVCVTCNTYDEATKIAKPFVERMIPVSISPIEVPKNNKPKEEK